MHRVRLVVVVVLAVFVTTLPAAAATNTAVASIHTTGSDFNNATTLENVSVVGSGDSAAVSLTTSEVDQFNDGDISEYSGDTSSFATQTTTVFEGSHALEGQAASESGAVKDLVSTSGLPNYPAAGDSFSYRIRINDNEDTFSTFFAAQSETAAPPRYAIVTNPEGSDLKIRIKHNGELTTLNTTSVSWSNHVDEWMKVSVDWQTDGTITATLNDSTGAEVATVSATNSTFTSGGIGFRASDRDAGGTGGTVAKAWWDAVTTDAAVEGGTYIGASHAVDSATGGFANLTLENATADVTWQQSTDGGATWTDVASAAYTTSGNKSASFSGDGQWRVNVTFTNDPGPSTAKLHDEGVRFTNTAPQLDDSSASPDGTKLEDRGTTLEINASDPDTQLAQGDSISVEFFLDGSSVGTDTLSSNDTASVSVSGLDGGDHEWHAVATDEYGGQTTSQTSTFKVPNTLEIRNVSAPDTLIQSPTEVEVTFFGDDGETVVTRNTTDGTIDMTGLPADQEFTVTASADGYVDRTTRIDSLYDQQEVYLLSENKSQATIVFELDDSTGRFPASETRLFVERPLNVSDNTTYKVVSGDTFGATGEFVTVLEDDTRYRLRVKNAEGETRVLGSYTTAGDDTAVLPIGQVSFGGSTGGQPALAARIIEENGQPAIRIVYRDPQDATTDLALEVVNASNSSDVLRVNDTTSGPFGTYVETVPVTENESEERWKVRYHATRDGAPDQGGKTFVGAAADISDQLGMDGQVLELIGLVALLAITGLVAILSAPLAALVGVVTATGLTMLGIIQIPTTLLGLAGVAALFFTIGGR